MCGTSLGRKLWRVDPVAHVRRGAVPSVAHSECFRQPRPSRTRLRAARSTSWARFRFNLAAFSSGVSAALARSPLMWDLQEHLPPRRTLAHFVWNRQSTMAGGAVEGGENGGE